MTAHRVPTYDVCGVPIAAVTPAQAVHHVIEASRNRRSTQVHLCNAFTLSLVDSDAELRESLRRSDLNLPDGTPVAWFGRGRGVAGPVRGPSFVGHLADAGRAVGFRHYFFGAGPGVADRMAASLMSNYPGMSTAGVESPPYGPMDDEAVARVAERVRAARSDVLWIGLGTPRQDYLVPRLAALLDIPVIPVGAAFDFWAGNVPEAPTWLQATGLEWIHRLASEPRRLWRRYLIGNPRFLLSALRHRVIRGLRHWITR